MSNTLGEAIRRERARAGMTQAKLARAIGVSVPYLSDLERGNRRMTLDRMFSICNEFPDADSAEWLWLLLSDQWGEPVADVMQRYAVAQNRPDRPQEAQPDAKRQKVTTDSGEAE